MLVTPAKWQRAKEDRDHEEIMRQDREAFRAFQREQRDYQRFRKACIVWGCVMTVLALAFVIDVIPHTGCIMAVVTLAFVIVVLN